MAKKVTVEEVLERRVLSYTTLDDAEKRIAEWKAKYSATHTNLRFDTAPVPWEDGYELCLFGTRPENDEERERRIEMEERGRESRRRYYESLKKEFGE